MTSSAGYRMGDVVKVFSNKQDPYSDAGRLKGEFTYVVAVEPGYIYVYSPFEDNYHVAQNMRIARMRQNRLDVRGLKVDSTYLNKSGLVQLNGAYNPRIEISVDTHGTIVINSIGSFVGEFYYDVRDLDTTDGELAYGFNDVSGYNNILIRPKVRFARHGATSNHNIPEASSGPEYWGGTRGHTVVDGVGEGCQGTTWDAHPGSRGDKWIRCSSYANLRTLQANNTGFQPRGVGGEIIDCYVGPGHEAFARITDRSAGPVRIVNPTWDRIPLLVNGGVVAAQNGKVPVRVIGGLGRLTTAQPVLLIDSLDVTFNDTEVVAGGITQTSSQFLDLQNGVRVRGNLIYRTNIIGAGARLINIRNTGGKFDGALRLFNSGIAFTRLLNVESAAATGSVLMKLVVEQGQISSLNPNVASSVAFKCVARNATTGFGQNNIVDFNDFLLNFGASSPSGAVSFLRRRTFSIIRASNDDGGLMAKKQFKVVAYGGSNTFADYGYLPFTASRLESATGRSVEIINKAVGNTFVHYGLYKAVAEKSHVDADLVVVEFAINDFELQGPKGTAWAEAFEGLIRRVRLDAPEALIATVILAPRDERRKTRFMQMAGTMDYVTRRYGGLTIDLSDLAKKHQSSFVPLNVIYKDGSHLSPAFQAVAGNILADAVLHPDFSSSRVPKEALCDRDLSSCLSLKATLGASFGATKTLGNSRVSLDCRELCPGETATYRVKGTGVLLSYGATVNDGILEIQDNFGKFYVSAMRKVFQMGGEWPFLESNILLWQARGKAHMDHSREEEIFIRLLPLEEERLIPEDRIYFRGSTIMPIGNDERRFYLSDIMTFAA